MASNVREGAAAVLSVIGARAGVVVDMDTQVPEVMQRDVRKLIGKARKLNKGVAPPAPRVDAIHEKSDGPIVGFVLDCARRPTSFRAMTWGIELGNPNRAFDARDASGDDFLIV